MAAGAELPSSFLDSSGCDEHIMTPGEYICLYEVEGVVPFSGAKRGNHEASRLPWSPSYGWDCCVPRQGALELGLCWHVPRIRFLVFVQVSERLSHTRAKLGGFLSRGGVVYRWSWLANHGVLPHSSSTSGRNWHVLFLFLAFRGDRATHELRHAAGVRVTIFVHGMLRHNLAGRVRAQTLHRAAVRGPTPTLPLC